MKIKKRYLLAVFIVISFVLFLYRENISLKPWVKEVPLEWIGSASSNGIATAIIKDAARTVVVIDNDGELLYKVHAGLFSSSSFVSAELVELDEHNNLYIYDKIFGGAYENSTERILKYSSNGEYLGVVYSYSYTNEDYIITKGKISGMSVYGDTLYLVRLEHEGFYLESVNISENIQQQNDPRIHHFFEYPNAFRGLLLCRLNVENQRIVWTTKSGNILIYSFSGFIINEIPANEDIWPFMALSNNNNDIVFTDIWNYKIGLIDVISGETKILFHRSLSDGIFYYYINNYGNTITASYNADEVLFINNDGSYTSIDTYAFSNQSLIIRCIIFLLCIINISILALFFIRAVLFIIKRKKRDIIKQIIVVGLCIIFGATISSLVILREMQKKNIEYTFSELEKISRLLAASVDVNIINNIHSPLQFDSEEYLSFLENVTSLFRELGFEGQQVYTMICVEREGIVYSVYDLEHALGSFHPWGEFEESFLEEVYTTAQYSRFSDNLPSGIWEYVVGPIFDKDGNVVAAIETGLNKNAVEAENRTMIIQTALIVLATTVAFLLIIIECLSMLDAYKKNKKEITVFRPELIRAAAFFMYFSANFATALLPIYAAELYIPVFNLPREFIVTLPFTAMAIMIIISLLLIPNIIQITGGKKISLISAILFFLGNINCIIAENIIHLSFGYALLGLSCGSFSLIFNTIIGSQKNAADMHNGFANLNAAYLSGVNVGVVFGAIIAQFFPYKTLFWFSSIIALIFLSIIIFSLRSDLFKKFYESSNSKQRLRKVSINIEHIKENATEKFALLKFLFKPVVFCILLMAFVPYIVSINFIEYFMPIYGMENGLGEANIGQLMLLSGLFAILFGASLCQFAAKKLPILLSVLFPLILNAGALYLFSLNVSIIMLIVTIVLLAIVNIFAATNIQTYFSLLYQKERISSIKALGVYSVIENIAMAAGPIVFSYILAINIASGIRIMAITMLGLTVVFALVSKFSIKWNNETLEKITE